MRVHCGELNFHLQVVFNWRLVRDGGMCPLLSVLQPHLVYTCAALEDDVSVFLSSYALQFCWFRGPCFLCVLHSNWLLTLFLPPLLQCSPSPEERNWMKTSYLELSVQRSLIHWIISKFDLYICFHLLQKKGSLMMAKQSPDLWVYQNVIRNNFIPTTYIFVFLEQ